MLKTSLRSGYWLFLAGVVCAADSLSETMHTAPRDLRFTAGAALTVEIPLDTAGIIRGGYPIDTSGYCDLPVVGRLYVIGHSQDEVETYLGERLANYLKDTHLKVSPAMRLTMLGHWLHQGQYYVPSDATVWEAARIAGGLAGERTLDQIRVWRGGRETEIPFLDVYSKGLTLAGAGFHSGDIIVVPVPRDNTGGWYWFKEYLGVTAQIAGIFSGIITTYITLEFIRDRQSN